MYQDFSLAFLEYEYEGERERKKENGERHVYQKQWYIFKLWYSLYMQYRH